jgi:hypothetical protein
MSHFKNKIDVMKTKGLIILIVLGSILYTNKAFTQIFVDTNATGNNNGTSWNDAYLKFQDALNDTNLVQIKEIWVAKGTYYPDEGINTTDDDRTSTFKIPDSVKVYGGFAGTETNLSQRNFFINETILSGDIDSVPDSQNNAYNVVTFINVSNQTLLDGFTITGGNAHEYMTNNFQGGGIYNYNSDVNGCDPVIKNCKIINNSAENGGGICNYGNTNPIVSNCIISGNFSFYGGGVSSLTTDSILSQPIFVNCLISGNESFYCGGGVHNYNSNAIYLNCTISGNVGVEGGGGIVNYNSHPVIVNSIIWGNNKFKGQIKNDTNSLPSYRYCDIEQSGGSSAWNLLIGSDGGNNIDTNPQLINISDTSAAPIFSGDFHVNNSSVVIDSGTPDTTGLNLPVKDLDGNPRIINNIDIGPYENNFSNVPSYWSGENVSFFPNPTATNITIITPAKATIEILNIEGQIIKTINTAEKQTSIDVSDLSGGIYIIKSKTERGVAVKKFIKD